MAPMANANSSGPSSEDINDSNLRKKPKPEFEGEVDPRTGEVGGPKNNPLGWQSEWTYGGRATDF